MKSLTIHSLPDEIYHKIKQRSQKEHRSLNQIMKIILTESFGLDGPGSKNTNEFDDLCGVWSNEDLARFEKENADFNQVNKEDWG